MANWAYICSGQQQAADLGDGGEGEGKGDSFALCLYSFMYQPGRISSLTLGPPPPRNSELSSGVLDEGGYQVREGQHYINKKKRKRS